MWRPTSAWHKDPKEQPTNPPPNAVGPWAGSAEQAKGGEPTTPPCAFGPFDRQQKCWARQVKHWASSNGEFRKTCGGPMTSGGGQLEGVTKYFVHYALPEQCFALLKTRLGLCLRKKEWFGGGSKLGFPFF